MSTVLSTFTRCLRVAINSFPNLADIRGNIAYLSSLNIWREMSPMASPTTSVVSTEDQPLRDNGNRGRAILSFAVKLWKAAVRIGLRRLRAHLSTTHGR